MSIITDTTIAHWDHAISVRGVTIPFVHPSDVQPVPAKFSASAPRRGVVAWAARLFRSRAGAAATQKVAEMRGNVASVVPEEFWPLVGEMSVYELARVWTAWHGVQQGWAMIVKHGALEQVVSEWKKQHGIAAGPSPQPSPTPGRGGSSSLKPLSPQAPSLKPQAGRRVSVPLVNGMNLPSWFDPAERTFGDNTKEGDDAHRE